MQSSIFRCCSSMLSSRFGCMVNLDWLFCLHVWEIWSILPCSIIILLMCSCINLFSQKPSRYMKHFVLYLYWKNRREMPESESITMITGACECLNCHFELFINNCSSIVSFLKIKGLGNMHLSGHNNLDWYDKYLWNKVIRNYLLAIMSHIGLTIHILKRSSIFFFVKKDLKSTPVKICTKFRNYACVQIWREKKP